jgi:nitroreductase
MRLRSILLTKIISLILFLKEKQKVTLIIANECLLGFKGNSMTEIDNKNNSYQERYLAHQRRKKEMLLELMKERHSNRMFSDKQLENERIQDVIRSLDFVPSSCDRKAIYVNIVTDRDKKALLSGLLVGGVGWIYRASAIILMFAARQAYSEGEVIFMPYLDAGVVAEQFYLAATADDLASCFVNPNIREFNIEHFDNIFNKKNDIFTGAFALGYKYEKEKSS